MFKKIVTVTFLSFAIFVLAAIGLIGCTVSVRGSGDVVEEGREVSNFDRVSLDGVGEVILTQGDRYSLVIEAEDNLMEYIKTSVRGDELTINIKSRRPILPSRPIKFYVTTPNLEAVSVDGAGTVTIDELKTDSLKLGINGSGQVTIDELDAEEVLIGIDGVGDLDLIGTADSVAISINGSGNFNGRNLESESASVNIDGLGSATINVENNLEVDVNGAGQVVYYGDPELTKSINGVGRVVQK